MRLLLPQDDPNPEARSNELAKVAAEYAYNRDTSGMLFVTTVPHGEHYDAPYVAEMARHGAEVMRNRASQRTVTWPEDGLRFSELAALPPAHAVAEAVRRVSATTGHLPDKRPTDLRGYADLIATMPAPLSFGHVDDDAFFAWQQVAGVTPITLRGIDAMPENLPIDAATYARATGETDRLDAALAEGRLFLSDYAVFDGIETGSTGGMQKYLWAPLALFARSPAPGGMLRPVAIQLGQRPGESNPIWTPADGIAWRMAKTAVQTADMNVNGVIAHFGLCHSVGEAFICISHRRLSPSHPLLHLLRPHFQYTLAVNETARTSLVSPGGTQDRLQSGKLEANFAITNRALAAQRFDAIGARADFAARRLDDVTRLPSCPFRDDGVPIADALHRWVEATLRVYYADDAAVVADAEVRAWAAELAGPGGFGGMPALDGVAALARFVGDMLWRLTGFHAVINYAGWDYAAWAPGMPSAGFGPGPSSAAATEQDWLTMLPSLSVANGMIELMYVLSVMRMNRLGDYRAGYFDDPRVLPGLARLHGDLEQIAKDTAARDEKRPWKFPFLHPSRISASIHV